MVFLVVWIIGLFVTALLLKYTSLKEKAEMPTLQTIGWPLWFVIELFIMLAKALEYLSAKYRKWING